MKICEDWRPAKGHQRVHVEHQVSGVIPGRCCVQMKEDFEICKQVVQIYAAQYLLVQQTKGKLMGWKSTQSAKRKKSFRSYPPPNVHRCKSFMNDSKASTTIKVQYLKHISKKGKQNI